MFLHASPRPIEVPGFSPQHLEDTLRSIEQKKQKLEEDIARYIQEKQEELCKHEHELLNQKPPATVPQPKASTETPPEMEDETADIPERPVQAMSVPTSPPERIEDVARHSKPTRVHKREKELAGLIAFLPLLDQNDPVAAKKKKKDRLKSKDGKLDLRGRAHSDSGEGSSSSKPGDQNFDSATSDIMGSFESRPSPERADSLGSESARSETPSDTSSDLKSRRPGSTKKSSLRRNSSKSRRKRVSIAIDDQIVHPSDNIVLPEDVTSPLSETAVESGSNSTSSAQSPAEPFQFTTPVYGEPGQLHPSTPLSLPDAVQANSAVLANSPPPLEYESPPKLITNRSLPITSPTKPLTPDDERDGIFENEGEVPVTSYVGSITGGSVDNINQSGSYGYPSSLGASYMESYMASRPLSVRMKAAEKAELKEEEARKLVRGDVEKEISMPRTNVRSRGGSERRRYEEEDAVEDIIGSMEGF